MALLDVQSVGFAYAPGEEVLRDLSLTIDRGEVVALVGPSGCGKSTLLSILAGFEVATGGAVRWEHAQGADDPGATRHGTQLALVFQRDTVLPWRTVERNVAFGMENLGVAREERSLQVEQLLRLGGLEPFAKAYPDTLSGGMRRRLALLMALAVMPRVLLLDEPFAAVDEPTRIALHADVLRMVYELGTSVIIVTHDLSEAISLADHVYVLSQRPATVTYSCDVPFGHERDVFILRSTDEYSRIYQELWSVVWAGT